MVGSGKEGQRQRSAVAICGVELSERAAVDGKARALDARGFLRGEEEHRARNVVARRFAAERHIGAAPFRGARPNIIQAF